MSLVEIVVTGRSLSQLHNVMVAEPVVTMCISMFYATVPSIPTAMNTLVDISVANLAGESLNLVSF